MRIPGGVLFFLTIMGLVAGGCKDQDTTTNVTAKAAASPQESGPGGNGPDSPLPAKGDQYTLSPDNTMLQFVGTHVGDKPDPRTGEFNEFSGALIVNEGVLKSIHVDIQTASLTTQIDKLTNHLKSPDFFDVRQFPDAKFDSSDIARNEDGTYTVRGELTLLGKSAPVTFPVTFWAEEGVKLDAQFTIDRTKFGMEYGVDRVEKDVTMTVKVAD